MSAATLASVEDAKAETQAIVKRSGTSFAAGMRILAKPRRDAMHAIYAFCRAVDDIADGPLPAVEKRIELAAWRSEIDRVFAGAPQTAIGLALREPVRAYNLPKEEFLLHIEGMEMDAEGPIVAPSMAELRAYMRRAAGAVGMLSMPVFGAPRTRAAGDFALALGDALQMTNILRDVREDAALGRLYLPRELLEKHGVPLTAASVANAPALAAVMRELGAIAKSRFAEARLALKQFDWRTVRPGLLMMGAYEEYLRRMEAADWRPAERPLRLSKPTALLIALRWFFAPRLA
jgi:phytoene synthase